MKTPMTVAEALAIGDQAEEHTPKRVREAAHILAEEIMRLRKPSPAQLYPIYDLLPGVKPDAPPDDRYANCWDRPEAPIDPEIAASLAAQRYHRTY